MTISQTIDHDVTCGGVAHYQCVEIGCGATYDGYDCGHKCQPTPVSPDLDGRPRCDIHAMDTLCYDCRPDIADLTVDRLALHGTDPAAGCRWCGLLFAEWVR